MTILDRHVAGDGPIMPGVVGDGVRQETKITASLFNEIREAEYVSN